MNNELNIREKIRLLFFKMRNRHKEQFECPICSYIGPFKDIAPTTGLRRHAQCPRCCSLERHRLQYLVVQTVLEGLNTLQMKMLHFAPEAFFADFYSQRFGTYETADFNMKDVNFQVDLQCLPFPDAVYDFVFASHVLEHIPNDSKAIQEIRRILKPNGIAILPVPIVSEKTVEYPEPNQNESCHMRAPGPDYFGRYTPHFSRVEKYSSVSFPGKYQVYIYEDRSVQRMAANTLLLPMPGEKHADYVPVCYV